MSDRRVVVVGAGSAGIAAGLALNDRGVRPLVLDRAERVGSAREAKRAAKSIARELQA